MDLSVIASTITVRCLCGNRVEFYNVHDGCQHIRFCGDCGQRVSVQIDTPIAQTLAENWPAAEAPR